MKFFKFILLAVIIIGIAAASIGYYFYNKKQADLSSTEAAFSLQADSLYNDFAANEQSANEKYLNKIIDVTGILAEINENADSSVSLTLKDPEKDFGVNCNILHPDKKQIEILKKGEKLMIRGVCSGYNSIEVALNNCVLVEKAER